MSDEEREILPHPLLIVVAAWLVPGAGYLLQRQYWRGVAIGAAIFSLFIGGLLIAGFRVVEVPGYDIQTGNPIMRHGRWVMSVAPMAELQNKLWSVPQALTGPIFLAASAASLHATQADPSRATGQLGAITHSRINEIGALYLSVAGLLNLIAIIDSTWRCIAADESIDGETT